MTTLMSGKALATGIMAVVAVAAGLTAFFLWQNNSLMVTRYTYSSPRVPAAFDGYSILHLSDLHNKSFGEGQSILLERMEVLDPDLIVITGDLIDRRRFDLDTAMELIDGAVEMAPVYFVAGNHEAWSGKYDRVKEVLQKAGVVVLDNEAVQIQKEEDHIHLLGLQDPAFLVSGYRKKWDPIHVTNQLAEWDELEEMTILLSHRPDLFSNYAQSQAELVFSGHAHGGQIRLPAIGSLFAPDQGFFPAYTEGVYTEEGTTMWVSRGLGNSLFPLRVFNRPELVLVTLERQETNT